MHTLQQVQASANRMYMAVEGFHKKPANPSDFHATLVNGLFDIITTLVPHARSLGAADTFSVQETLSTIQIQRSRLTKVPTIIAPPSPTSHRME